MKKNCSPDGAGEVRTETYFITGGAGFIGSHLSELLLERGKKILSIDNLSTGRMSNIAHLLPHPNFRFSRADVMNEVVLDRLASEADVTIHLAASVGVEKIVKSPAETIQNNVKGTEVVLEAALRYQNRVLIASTSEVYGKGSKIPFHEDDDVLLGPTSKRRWSYAASKMVDEFLGLAYFDEFDIPVSIVRLFNTIGPRQTGQYGMVIPRFMERALRGEPLAVHGDGTQCRCFCDVADAILALAALADEPKAAGRVLNVGGSQEISIYDLAVKIKEMTQSASDIIRLPYSEAYAPGFEDMQRRVPDTTRIQELIGWTPRISLDESLERVRAHLVEEMRQEARP